VDKNFEWAYKFTSKWEGGYVDNPADPGGRTNYGVTQAVASQYGLGDVRNLTPEAAKGFYYRHYWKVWSSGWFLNAVMFDTAANFGLQGSREFLQEALGFKGEDVDGKVGPVTLGRLKIADHDEVARHIVEARLKYRHQRVASDPSQKGFLDGWLNRDMALQKMVAR
jgi:lysozyme family protein